ncbi:hypothetical protein E2C01_089045 [Portunus trituberculatus]|uniref:Uncharacterized protein n=1 Tax=Portunus trituberculatus TaxID=210409 RepID=A0A5B7JG83_PORTR|nr:hypothetical protein [Portunus trituberculatus]
MCSSDLHLHAAVKDRQGSTRQWDGKQLSGQRRHRHSSIAGGQEHGSSVPLHSGNFLVAMNSIEVA